MTSLTLYKVHADQKLAHLYEHIWAAHLSSLLRSKDLYAYIDYTIDAKTHQNGLIEIAVYLYTSLAAELAEEIKQVKIDATEEVIETALLQVMAENEEVLGSSPNELRAALNELDSWPWSDKPHSIPKAIINSKLLWPIQSIETQDIRLKISHKKLDDPFDKAALYVLSLILISNLQEDLSDSHGLFSNSDEWDDSGSKLVFVNYFGTVLREYEFTDEDETIGEVYEGLITQEVLERFLEHVEASNDPKILPFMKISEISSSKIDRETWIKGISTRRLLKLATNLKISLSAGQKELHIL